MRPLPVAFGVVAGVLASACLRAPIDGEGLGAEGELAPTDADDHADGPGMTGPIGPDGDVASTGDDADAPPSCHPSYAPCLPVVDDLNCDEVRAMGAAPVDVLGEDAYGLDADDDGIGCEI